MAKAEKIELGALKVNDKGRMDRNEIIIEMVDEMQKLTAEAEALARDTSRSLEDRYNGIKNICGRFCGLSNFLNCTIKIEVRDTDGSLYTQKMFNRIYYHETMLKIELGRAGQ